MYRNGVKYKFYYFPALGRGEFIRYIIAYTKISCEEVIVDMDTWKSTVKKEMPLGTLPVLELEDGRQLSQSLAIARYLGKKYGLVSQDDFENAWGDQLSACLEDIYPAHYVPYAYAIIGGNAEAVASAWESMKTKAVEPLFERFEHFLGTKEWFCGNRIHWSDLVIAEWVNRVDTVLEKGYCEKFPKLYAHCLRVHDLQPIKEYMEMRPKNMKW